MENEATRPAERMPEARRQELINRLGASLGELFADGLNECSELVKRSIIDGVSSGRVRLCIEVELAPLEMKFGIRRQGCEPMALFAVTDPKRKTLKVEQLMSGNDSVN